MFMFKESVFSLYRTYLRQVRALPHLYLRHFFRLKGADDFRSVLRSKSVDLRRRKLRRALKDLQRLRAANGGQSTAFDHILDVAYGRVGRLRWELMEPLLSVPNHLHSPSDSQKERTQCSPSYSPELAALLTSGVSRTARALQRHHLVSPPGLPGRAQPNSEDAVLMGRLSTRREYNIRWRFFKSESKKVYPPLQISLHNLADPMDTPISHLPVNFGFQDVGTLQELLTLAGSPSRTPEFPSKLEKLQQSSDMSNANPFDGNLPVRWLRRRYQALLGRVPFLVLRPSSPQNVRRSYDVQLANSAITALTPRIHSSRLRDVDARDVSWISDVDLMLQYGSRRR